MRISRLALRNVMAVLLALPIVLSGCAGDIVVRIPAHRADAGAGTLSRVPATTVRIARVTDARRPGVAIGRREALGTPMGDVFFDPTPMHVVRDVLIAELTAAGHAVAPTGAPVELAVDVLAFTAATRSTLLSWDVTGTARIAVQVLRAGEVAASARLEYGAERSQRTYTWPRAGLIQGLLTDCVADIARQVRDDARLAAALAGAAPSGG
jgi:hypothetical protein